jgi:hypothetical protein
MLTRRICCFDRSFSPSGWYLHVFAWPTAAHGALVRETFRVAQLNWVIGLNFIRRYQPIWRVVVCASLHITPLVIWELALVHAKYQIPLLTCMKFYSRFFLEAYQSFNPHIPFDSESIYQTHQTARKAFDRHLVTSVEMKCRNRSRATPTGSCRHSTGCCCITFSSTAQQRLYRTLYYHQPCRRRCSPTRFRMRCSSVAYCCAVYQWPLSSQSTSWIWRSAFRENHVNYGWDIAWDRKEESRIALQSSSNMVTKKSVGDFEWLAFDEKYSIRVLFPTVSTPPTAL